MKSFSFPICLEGCAHIYHTLILNWYSSYFLDININLSIFLYKKNILPIFSLAKTELYSTLQVYFYIFAALPSRLYSIFCSLISKISLPTLRINIRIFRIFVFEHFLLSITLILQTVTCKIVSFLNK